MENDTKKSITEIEIRSATPLSHEEMSSIVACAFFASGLRPELSPQDLVDIIVGLYEADYGWADIGIYILNAPKGEVGIH